ncbi:MAG: rhodanese-like domain-containing protein [Terriglobales bacterium]
MLAYTGTAMDWKNGFLLRGLPFLLLAAVFGVLSLAADQKPGEVPPAALVQSDALSRSLQSPAGKPTILYVGPRFLYTQAHIPGAEFIGPASDSASLQRLKARAGSLKKDAPIVVYCGCCPWDHCPNIRPAYKQLQDLGFTKVKALYLATSFGADWVEKGYPVEKGEPAAK